jgi:phage N-6-adenine-methyltransferase
VNTRDITNCLSSKSTEWYTPKKYIEAARLVMGSIDVDPASNAYANEIVKAAIYYTKETNGYDKPWPGNVWLNPPYGYDGPKANQSRWSQRLIEQYQAGITKQAVLLVSANMETKWFQAMCDYPVCLPDHRINFYQPDGKRSGSTHASALVYLGPNIQRFIQVFRQFGRVMGDMDLYPTRTLWTPVEPENEVAV